MGGFANQQSFNSLPDGVLRNLQDETTKFLAVYNKPLGTLNITGRGTNQYGKTTVFCSVALADTSVGEVINTLKTTTENSILLTQKQIATCLPISSSTVAVVSREKLLSYTEYENLASLPLDTVAQVKQTGFISYYGIERMINLTDKGSFKLEMTWKIKLEQ